jgi:cytochrome P450
MSSLIGFENLVNKCSSIFEAQFQNFAVTGQTINLGHWFQCYAFDVIGTITFGQGFGFLDDGKDDVGAFSAIDTRTSYSTFVGIYPFLHRIIFPYLPTTGGHGYVGKFTNEQISKREQAIHSEKQTDETEPSDLAWKFLKTHITDPAKMTYKDVFTMCQSNIGAGSDTTALTLSATLYYLLKYPATYKRLQQEIDEAVSMSKISNPITFKEAQQLPYLQAVIREALRIHSATGLPLSRIVPPTGATIANYQFPAGATVGINSWVAHRNKEVYGSDAFGWRPERWLEIDASGRGGEIERYFFAFGMGSRTCIGKNISLLEISKLIPQLLRTFDFELDDELVHNEWKSASRWFVKPDNFRGRVMVRNKPS